MPPVSTLFKHGKMGDADGMEGQRGLSTRCDVARWKHHFAYDFTGGGLPTAVEVVLEQQTVWQIHHSQVLKSIARATFHGFKWPPNLQRPKQIGLIGAGDVPLIDGDQNHRFTAHGRLVPAHLF